ncbi:MAG TPA: efflux RND transporter periplasmic adaptor subunit [Bacillus bacterium]|nr:efflux RND transporter periplasmic adaptor subunit [Bacillus sp. (in: firmicutes)]
MKKLFRFFLLLFFSISTLTGCSEQKATVDYAEIYVTDYIVEEQSISSEEKFYGEIVSEKTVTLSSTIPGTIQIAPQHNGQKVEKGDVLFVVENKDLQSERLNAKAAVEVAKANLEKIKAGANLQEVMGMEESVQASKVKYDAAVQNKERLTVLFDSGAISKQQLEQAETELAVANSQYNSSQHQLEQMKLGPTKETIRIAEAQYEQANGLYSSITAKTADLVIKSPLSGFIAALQAEEGEFVGVGMPLVNIHNIEEVYVHVNVPEASFLRLKQGETANVKSAAIDQPFSGTIIELTPQADRKTNLFTIKIKINNGKSLLKPGMAVEVTIPIVNKTNTMIVPISAVLNDKGQEIVYVIEDGIVEKRKIKTGIRTNTNIEVISGLQKGEKIVVDGVEFVHDGDQVQVVEKESEK